MELPDEQKSALEVQGQYVTDIFKILNIDGVLEAVQLVFAGGSSLTLTVWTDWTIRADRSADSAIPTYLSPPNMRIKVAAEDISFKTGNEISRVERELDQVGALVRVDIEFSGFDLLIGSRSGEITMSIRRRELHD